MISNTTKAHAALLGANTIYGASYIIGKGIMPEKIDPTALVVIRLGCCALLFWILKRLYTKDRIEKKDIFRFMVCGLLGGAASQLLFFHGISLTSPIDASIIMTLTPVAVLVFSLFILKEPITRNKLLGITIGGIGAITLIVYGSTAVGTSSFLGNLFIFLNACFYGFFLVLAKSLMKKYHAFTVTSWMFIIGFLFVLPFGIDNLIATDFGAFTLNTYLISGYMVLFTTFFAYLLNIYALNHVSPSINSSYIYFQPAISFIIVSIVAYTLMDETYSKDINWIKILSCLLVIGGVYLVSKAQKPLKN